MDLPFLRLLMETADLRSSNVELCRCEVLQLPCPQLALAVLHLQAMNSVSLIYPTTSQSLFMPMLSWRRVINAKTKGEILHPSLNDTVIPVCCMSSTPGTDAVTPRYRTDVILSPWPNIPTGASALVRSVSILTWWGSQKQPRCCYRSTRVWEDRGSIVLPQNLRWRPGTSSMIVPSLEPYSKPVFQMWPTLSQTLVSHSSSPSAFQCPLS